MQKCYVMAIKQHLWKNALNLQSIQEKIIPNIFPAIRSTKHFVDWVSANYNGYYMLGSSKSDKYGFFWHLPDRLLMRLDMFLNLSTKFRNLS